jgi:hypothetical protein
MITECGRRKQKLERVKSHPETHTKRQATQHGCLYNLLGDGDGGEGRIDEPEKVRGATVHKAGSKIPT